MAARTIGKPDLNRLRVSFGKDGRLAFLGHLEVINTIERSVRRAGLPFSVGNGFARRMRVQFSQALPVGAASRCEYYDLYLTERVDAREALSIVEAVSPRAVVPMHYRSDGQGFGYKVIAPVEEFLSLLPPEPVTRLIGPAFSLTETLPVGTAVPHLEM